MSATSGFGGKQGRHGRDRGTHRCTLRAANREGSRSWPLKRSKLSFQNRDGDSRPRWCSCFFSSPSPVRGRGSRHRTPHLSLAVRRQQPLLGPKSLCGCCGGSSSRRFGSCSRPVPSPARAAKNPSSLGPRLPSANARQQRYGCWANPHRPRPVRCWAAAGRTVGYSWMQNWESRQRPKLPRSSEVRWPLIGLGRSYRRHLYPRPWCLLCRRRQSPEPDLATLASHPLARTYVGDAPRCRSSRRLWCL
mmetsp:Transcript_97674/g.244778  ORF Transcript_97674/g.244778 Transcript_97674/m.244778 type:complete len:248 (+) Transcript_97674:632-1375(+)